MPGEIFRTLLIMSAAGTALAILIIFLTPLTKKIFGYSWNYYIWLSVLIVMIFPIRFNTFQFLPNESPIQVNADASRHTETAQTYIKDSSQEEAPKNSALKSSAELIKINLGKIFNYLGIIWFFGMVFIFFFNIVRYVRFIRRMHKNSSVIECPGLTRYTKRKIIVRVGEDLASPFMTGIFRPVLMLPKREIDEIQLDNIFRHEITHFKRGDIFYKWFAVTVRSVHWFNPAAYYAVHRINIECEISCDLSVVSKMDKKEEMSYINTIISLLTSDNLKGMPLSTRMTGSKKILKRRFVMIKNRKKTGRIMSAASALTAAAMITATVFAGSAISAMIKDDYDIEIINDGKKIELVNKPFLENDSIYLPLRETIEAMGFDRTNSRINWDNGAIDIALVQSSGMGGLFGIKIGGAEMQLKHIDSSELYSADFNAQKFSGYLGVNNVPLLKNSTAYITLKDLNYILYGFFNMRDENNSLYELTYTLYDGNGNKIINIDELNATAIITSSYESKTPEYSVEQFFDSFSRSDFITMRRYCTQNCEDRFFGEKSVFGMSKASLISMDIDPMERAKSSNDFNVFVTVGMTPDELSVFDLSETNTSFYICLLRQPDGRYLIDSFVTGL